METIFRLYYARLYHFASRLIEDKMEVEDIVQDCMMNFWIRAKEKEDFAGNIEAYLFRSVKNRCLNYLQRTNMRAEKNEAIAGLYDSSTPDAEALLSQEQMFDLIYKEFLHLPARQSEIMKYMYVDGLSTQEIADRLSITPNNVRINKARAIQKLRASLLKGLFLLFLILFYFFSKIL
jgi:RNA polymerase sigma-70 factor (ECF subfamily)